MTLELIGLDVGNTVLDYKIWDQLGKATGSVAAFKTNWKTYHGKKDQFREWFHADCALLKGVKVTAVQDKLLLSYAQGVREFVDYIHGLPLRQRPLIGIISGGINLITNPVAEDLGLEFVEANEVDVEDGYFTGTGQVKVDLSNKGEVIGQYLDDFGIPPENAAYIGNGKNDISAWKAVGLPIGVSASADLQKYIGVNALDFYTVLDFVRWYIEGGDLEISPRIVDGVETPCFSSPL